MFGVYAVIVPEMNVVKKRKKKCKHRTFFQVKKRFQSLCASKDVVSIWRHIYSMRGAQGWKLHRCVTFWYWLPLPQLRTDLSSTSLSYVYDIRYIIAGQCKELDIYIPGYTTPTGLLQEVYVFDGCHNVVVWNSLIIRRYCRRIHPFLQTQWHQ